MPLSTKNEDGHGTSKLAGVQDGALLSMAMPFPPFGVDQRLRVFRQYLTDDGLAGGTSSMLVNGTSTNVDYYIPADANNDRYIASLSFVIADASASLNQFGNVTALNNGCVLEYSDVKGVVTIHDALKTNFNFVRLCLGNPAWGQQANSFIANNVTGSSEAFLPVLDFRTVFGMPWGVRLLAGSVQKVTLRIRDDCSGIDQFDCIAYGFERSP